MSVVGRRQTRRRRRVRRRRVRLKNSANAVLLTLLAGVHGLTESIGWSMLFFALMLSLAMAVVWALLGEVGFAALFFVSSLFLCVALWTRELK
jgi:hypothetical protein